MDGDIPFKTILIEQLNRVHMTSELYAPGLEQLVIAVPLIVQSVPRLHYHLSTAAMMEHRIKVADAEQRADTICQNEKSLWLPCRVFRLNIIPKQHRLYIKASFLLWISNRLCYICG
jgi:hypothetical protein